MQAPRRLYGSKIEFYTIHHISFLDICQANSRESSGLPPEGHLLRVDRLKTLREQRGWSQRELSRRCGFGEAQIGKYESGTNDISATNLKIIADLFEVSIDYLLGTSDTPNRLIAETTLSAEEQDIVQAYRRQGWSGVFHLGAERIAK